MHYLPYISTLVTFAFAVAVFLRYLKRRGLHLLLWTIGLVFYGIGTLAEVLLAFTFSGPVLKLWYLSGAMLTAAWLGQVFVKGSVAATGSTSYTYAFTPAGTADDVSSITAEYGWVANMGAGTPGVMLKYLLGDQLSIRWDKTANRVSYDASFASAGTATDLTAFTGTPTSPTSALVTPANTVVSLDASTIGSTVDSYVRSAEWVLNLAPVPLYTLTSSAGAQLVARPNHRKWTLKIQRAYYGGKAERDIYKTKAERKIRLITTGPTLGSSAYKITTDFYGKAEELSYEEADGYTMESITYSPYYDTGTSTDFVYTVVCADATIT